MCELVIKRINNYHDRRFSDKILKQHGAFTVGDYLYEVEIISDNEAIVHGKPLYAKEVIDEFRFFAEHINVFYNEEMECVASYEPVEVFPIGIEDIQPSQFYVDREKKQAVASFINKPEDVIIPLCKLDGKLVSIDGHTRLSVAIDKGYKQVKGFLTHAEDYVEIFVREAERRGINSPYDIEELSHDEYEIKWNKYCEQLFEE